MLLMKNTVQKTCTRHIVSPRVLQAYFLSLAVTCCMVLLGLPALASAVEISSEESEFSETSDTVYREQPASPSTSDLEKTSEDKNLIGETFESLQHQEISASIESLSRRLDAFFGDPRLFEEITSSYASLRASTLYERGGKFTFDSKFRLRLDLPRTEERLKFRLETEDDEFQDEIDNPQTGGERALGDNDVNASLQYMLQETRNWVVSISPGLKVRDPLDPFVKLRLRRTSQFLTLTTRLIQTFEWFNTTGYGSRTTFSLDQPFGEKTLLRLTSQAYRNEEEFVHEDFEVSERFLLFHQLNTRVALSTEAAVIGYTEPNWHHDSYYWYVRFRRDIHKGFVFFDIRPRLDFRRENNFHGEPSVTLSFEILYGARYIQP